MIDLLLIAIVALVAWCVASEGALGAALTLISVLFAGLLAMNFFEPAAAFLETGLGLSGAWSYRWDMIALLGTFAVLVFVFRLAGERIVPQDVPLPGMVYEAGRWTLAVLTGYATMAILLTALHTAPLPREFLGFTPERRNLLNLRAPDREWLGFTQYVSEKALRRGEPRVFDGPQLTLPGQPVDYWPSFPIRYATRRQRFASGGAETTTAPVRVRPRTSGGGSSPGSGF